MWERGLKHLQTGNTGQVKCQINTISGFCLDSDLKTNYDK